MTRLAVTVAALLLPLLCGCQEKTGVEKRAEEVAKQQASASASASAKVHEPDPKELEYAAKRKAVLDRAKAQLAALQKIYGGVPETERQAFRDFFPATKEGLKEADDISKEAAFAGKQGMSITKYEVSEVNFDEKLETAVTDVSEDQSQRGKARCVIYKLEWKQEAGAWKRVARKDFRIVPCGS